MYRNIPVLADGFAGILFILKEVLNNRVYPERYAIAARFGVEKSWDQIAALLAPLGHKSLVMFKGVWSCSKRWSWLRPGRRSSNAGQAN